MIQVVTLAQLSLSPINVRVTDKDAYIDSLAADIEARGLKQNLVVIPGAEADSFEVIAGGRRFQALKRLFERGVIPENYGVPVMLEQACDGVETSLAENIQRVAMNPADEYTAFDTIYSFTEGTHAERVEHLCKRFGRSKQAIEQRLRLGQLEPCILEALRLNKITLAQATAFGITADQDRQKSVWTSLGFDEGGTGHGKSADRIRQVLTEGAVNSTDRIAIFVGQQAYEAAGGIIERNLFSEEDESVWLNGDIVRDLATASMAAVARMKKDEDGWQEVRFTLDAQPDYYETEHLGRFTAHGVVKLNKKQKDQITKLETEHAKLRSDVEAISDGKGLGEWRDGTFQYHSPEIEKIAQRIDAINAEIKAINRDAEVEPYQDEHGRFIRYIVIQKDGSVDYAPSWYSVERIDYNGKLIVNADGSTGTSAKAPSPTAEAGLSQSHADLLAGQRRDILAAVLTKHTGLAYEYGVFSLVDRKLQSDGYAFHRGEHSTLQVGRTEDPYRWPSGTEQQTAALDELAEFYRNLNWSWFGSLSEDGQPKAEGTEVERFQSFCQLTQREKDQWFAWVVTQSLKASNAIDRQKPIHDHLAQTMGINVPDWWRPDTGNYWSKISGSMIEAQLKEAGALTADASIKLKKVELTADAQRIFAGEKPVNACFVTDEHVRSWTPAAMRFDNPVTKAS